MPPHHDPGHVVVLGAGPAGLTAARELALGDVDVTVFEADDIVGGIARTASYRGFRFDLGGHRFFSKSAEVRKIWEDILEPDEWLRVPRLSRIHYHDNLFSYPLKGTEALRRLGPVEAALCVLSYLRAKLQPRRDETTLENWVVNRFGHRLYTIFFKTYTEKVWGMPCNEISADWASQRIQGLSFTRAVRDALPKRKPKPGADVVKTLIDAFDYPTHGPGMMWERAAEQVEGAGGTVALRHRVTRLVHTGGRVTEVGVTGSDGTEAHEPADAVISTLPMRDLVHMCDPPAPTAVREAADELRYRDFLTVVLIVEGDDLFPDNWIYIHDERVRVGRVQNFKNWSPHMVPEPGKTALGLEYFCFEGDGLWESPDDELIALGRSELHQLGLADATDLVDGTVVRVPKAYPVYDATYQRNVNAVRAWLAGACENLQLVGRNGMHKYNNQDHSMMAALLAAKNLMGECWDPWKVNTDAEYHEEVHVDADQAGRMMPRKAPKL